MSDRKGIVTLPATIISAASLMLVSCAQEAPVAEKETVAEAMADNGDLISLAGTVVSVAPSTFLLDYGGGRVTVELDDWDFYGEASALAPGDRVEVTGRVDDNLFMANTIEASSVYVDNLDTYFFASAADEESANLGSLSAPASSDGVNYTGWVTDTSGDTFTLGAGPTKVTVDMSDLDSPLRQGKLEIGDRVHVWGDLEIGKNGQSKFVAEGLVELITTKIPGGEDTALSSEETSSTPSN